MNYNFGERLMDISVVIITWNSTKYISNCMKSLLASINTSEISFEILIVDNGSNDSTLKKIETFQEIYPKKISITALKVNMGTTYSRNIALKKAKGDYLVILDSDIEILSDSIFQLIRILKSNNSIGIAVPKLLYPDGGIQKSTDSFPTITSKLKRFLFLKQIEKKMSNTEISNNPVYVDYAISAFWVINANLIKKIGLLDEKIFYAPEDVDFCLRTWKAGYKILYNPQISSIHHTQEISRGPLINKAKIIHIKGLFYYFRKHKYFFKAPKFQIMLPDGH